MKSNALIFVLIALVAANLALTAGLYFREVPDPVSSGPTSAVAEFPAELSEAQVEQFTQKIVDLYNQDDVARLYELFDDLAKIQLPRETFESQMADVAPAVGRVDSFSLATFAQGNFEGRAAYELRYKARLREGPFSLGSLVVTLVERKDELRLLSFRVNGESN